MQATSSKQSAERAPILNVREEMDEKRTAVTVAVDAVGRTLCRPITFFLVQLFHLGWVALNLRMIPGLAPWDPSPFTLLATIASALAPILSLMILMRQHRDTRVAELREEVQLQVSLNIERKLTHTLRLLDQVGRRLDVQDDADPDELDEMKQPLDSEKLMDRIRQHLDDSEGPME